jgi:hypothetical protein
MPAIRDFSTSYVASSTTISVPVCDYVQNDLLLIFCAHDAAVTYTTPAGWTLVTNFPSQNTVTSTCFWKIAGATETDVTVTNSSADTNVAAMVSIRDVNTSTPFGATPLISVATHTAASRHTLPSITTNVADALVLYFYSAGGSSTSAPPLGVSCIEGEKTQQLLVVDGTSEGMSVGWIFQKATGATPAAYAVNPAFATYGVGSMAAIQIAPPSGGATVIPPYLAQDTSVLLEHNSGTAAFDGNTGMAATADTAGFGTSITVNGSARTIGDATVAAVADVGINSYHSMNGLTNAASAYMSGAQHLLGSTRYNLGNANILSHLRAATPANNQRLAPVVGFRGCWMGLRSGTTASTNYKIWQVHGADAPFAPGSVIPVIVNIANTDHIASAGTLSNSDVRNVGYWVGGLGALTSQVGVGLVWKMGVVTVAGGNASEPVGIAGILAVAATAKERLSTIKQGANQLLCLQELQFGDGGTNPVYLNLDATAIEFPERRNVSKKTVYYNGIDDSVGISYYPGATDTIKHKNSVISSANKFKWGLHASASTSASYDFSGTSVIGAGTIFLGRAITITELTINGYGTLDVSNLTLTYSAIKGMPATNNSMTSNASTNIDYCTINTSTVTAGNYWCSVADPSIFTGNTFTGGGGHAIRITTPGTYNFSGNIFNGYGADGSTGAAILNDSGGAVTINISGGGSTPTYKNGTSATTTINNAVTVTVTVKDSKTLAVIQNARVRIVTTSGSNLVLEGVTNASGVLSGSTTYVGSAVTGTVRRATVALGTLYKPYDISATVGAGGLDVTALMQSDE